MFSKKPQGIDPLIVELQLFQARAEILLENHRVEINKAFESNMKQWDRIRELEEELKEATKPVTFFGNAPIGISEEAEDAKWQLDNGIIDRQLYEEILKEVGLEPNVEIHY